MLFFKEIMEEKLTEPGFKQFFDQECHICPTTLKVISDFAEVGLARDPILGKLEITQKEFNDLYFAENCDPCVVIKLCRYLGMNFIEWSPNCPKFNMVDSSRVNPVDNNGHIQKITKGND